MERKISNKLFDVEVRQLRSLRAAYSADTGPEVLVFGDSAMFWAVPSDPDKRPLVQMVKDELGSDITIQALVGPGYNGRIVSAFLSALPLLRSKPRVIVVPTSVLMAQRLWIDHPSYSYEIESAALTRAIAEGDRRIRRLPRPTPEHFEEYDRLPAPSLFGARRTAGEIRLVNNSNPTTKWQGVVRLRHLMDSYNAERLEDETPGVKLVGELACRLAEIGIPHVAYIAPINHDVVRSYFGEPGIAHVRRNADVVAGAFASNSAANGRIADCVMDSPAIEFCDPVHLNSSGRLRLAKRLADEIRLLTAEATA